MNTSMNTSLTLPQSNLDTSNNPSTDLGTRMSSKISSNFSASLNPKSRGFKAALVGTLLDSSLPLTRGYRGSQSIAFISPHTVKSMQQAGLGSTQLQQLFPSEPTFPKLPSTTAFSATADGSDVEKNHQDTRDLNPPKSHKSEAGERTEQSDKKHVTIPKIITLADYHKVISNKRHSTVVVRFYSDYCKTCHRTKSLYQRLADLHPQIKFIQVPFIAGKNDDLLTALEVNSAPYGMIYHSEPATDSSVSGDASQNEKSIIERGSLGKKAYIAEFHKILTELEQADETPEAN